MAKRNLGNASSKAIVAFAALILEDAAAYDKVKETVRWRYEINKETYHQQLRQDHKKGKESYREYAEHLGDHFTR